MRRTHGFTLLEVLVAMAIFAGAIIVINSAWSGNFLRIRKSALLNSVATLLEQKMAETEAKYQGKSLEEIPESDGGDFGSDYPRYTWKLKSRDLKFPDLTPMLVGQQDGADEMMISMIKQMTDYLNQVVKEVKVTVSVKAGAKTLDYSAVEYFVDYNKPFGGGGGGMNPGSITPTPGGAGGGK